MRMSGYFVLTCAELLMPALLCVLFAHSAGDWLINYALLAAPHFILACLMLPRAAARQAILFLLTSLNLMLIAFQIIVYRQPSGAGTDWVAYYPLCLITLIVAL